MKRLLFAATVLMLGLTTRSQAQTQYQRPMTSPYYRPPVNPILNTLGSNRGGMGGGIGYYTQTRPQVEAFRQLGQLQQGQLLQGQQLAGLQGLGQGAPFGAPPSQGITGHSVAFFNYSHYYTSPSPRYPSSTSAGTTLGSNSPVTSPLQDPNFGRAPQGPGIGIIFGTQGRDDR